MCGLVGYIPNKKSKINILRFKSLMLYNEDRGKLSTGIYNIDGVFKDTVSATEFAKNQQWHDLYKNSIFLGHTRQPTVGYPVTMHGAQPIEVGNIVIVHNGTIYNKKDLANKYNVKLEDNDTDSIVIAKILETKQFDVLNDYNGAAALIWVYKDEPDNLYLYKGESYRTQYSQTKAIERPLYGMKTKEGIYISSIELSLSSIALAKLEIDTIGDIMPNKIFRMNINNIKRQEVIFETTVDRFQDEIYFRNSHNEKKKKNKNYHNQSDFWKNRLNSSNVNDNSWYENNNGIWVYGNQKLGTDIEAPGASKEVTKGSKDTEDIPSIVRLEKEFEFIAPKDSGYIFNDVDDYCIEYEEIDSKNLKADTIYYNKGRYWMNNAPVNGIYDVFPDGTLGNANTSAKEFKFIEGILLDSCNDIYYKSLTKSIEINNYTFGTKQFAFILRKHTKMPVAYYSETYSSIVFCDSINFFTEAVYEPLFLARGDYVFYGGYYCEIEEYEVYDIGDVIETKYEEKVIVTEVLKSGVRGHAVGDDIISYHGEDDIIAILETVADNEIAKEDSSSATEGLEIKDITSELVDGLSDAIEQLERYKENDVATGLVEMINEFKQNKLAM